MWNSLRIPHQNPHSRTWEHAAIRLRPERCERADIKAGESGGWTSSAVAALERKCRPCGLELWYEVHDMRTSTLDKSLVGIDFSVAGSSPTGNRELGEMVAPPESDLPKKGR